MVSGAATVGTLRSAAAAELGVPAGLPVKLGVADTSSAMLAAGMGPGDLLHVVGTTQVLATVAEHPRPDPKRLTRYSGVGTAFVHVTHNPVGGAALEWLRELVLPRAERAGEFYERTLPAAGNRRTRVTLDPPHLGGDRLEIEAHRAAFRDLTLATDRMDLLAARVTGDAAASTRRRWPPWTWASRSVSYRRRGRGGAAFAARVCGEGGAIAGGSIIARRRAVVPDGLKDSSFGLFLVIRGPVRRALGLWSAASIAALVFSFLGVVSQKASGDARRTPEAWPAGLFQEQLIELRLLPQVLVEPVGERFDVAFGMVASRGRRPS